MTAWFFLALSILLLLAFSLVGYSLSLKKKGLCMAISFISLGTMAAYLYWGSWSDWQAHQSFQAKQHELQAVLKTIKGPEELIPRLKARLDDQPASAKGWYLLGKLYMGQSQWNDAQSAFAKAHTLEPANEEYAVFYGQILWQMNHNQFSPIIRSIFQTLLQHNARQPDALAMLAMDAFLSQKYQVAIQYWERLLTLMPETSEDAAAIRKAIAKAHAKQREASA